MACDDRTGSIQGPYDSEGVSKEQGTAVMLMAEEYGTENDATPA
jgi:hypothetical protein